MNKQIIPWLITACLAVVLVGYMIQNINKKESSDLTPNWNISYATGPHLYQQLANSFVFVIKRTPDAVSWQNGDYGDGQYALFMIQRGRGKVVCPAYSGLSIDASNIDLDPFVGKAVLVTGFTHPDERSGSIRVEKLELDNAVNAKLEEYRRACPVPFQKMDESLGGIR
jgi:hypothetical protein